MTIHKAGYALLLKGLVILVALNAIIFCVGTREGTVARYIFLAVSCLLYFWMVLFFRFPKRIVVSDDGTILAPADGKVVVVEETEEQEYLHERRIQVSIFMSLFNVHINWFPVNGIIKYFKYHEGNFAAAFLPKSSMENERTTIVIATAAGPTIVMRQIAGAMARRIVTYAPIGGSARQDKHAGFIKFGSRVDLFLPMDTKIEVKLGQKTVGSQTVIGHF